MKWYYKVKGGHTHVRVFMNGAKCGDLVFRNEEFTEIKYGKPNLVLLEDTCDDVKTLSPQSEVATLSFTFCARCGIQMNPKTPDLERDIFQAIKDKHRLDCAAKYIGNIDLHVKPINRMIISEPFICEGSNLRDCLDKIIQGIESATKKPCLKTPQ